MKLHNLMGAAQDIQSSKTPIGFLQSSKNMRGVGLRKHVISRHRSINICIQAMQGLSVSDGLLSHISSGV